MVFPDFQPMRDSEEQVCIYVFRQNPVLTILDSWLSPQVISDAGRYKLDFAKIDQYKPVLLGLSLAGNLVKPLMSLYGTEWRDRGYGLRGSMT